MTAGEWFAASLVLIGCGFFFAGTVGLLRFPDTLARLHAIVKADNVGLGFICLGLAVYDGSLAGGVRLLVIWLLALVASAISAFLVARWSLGGAAAREGVPDWRPGP